MTDRTSETVGAALANEGGRAGVTILDLRYDLEDKPPAVQSILFGLQHVLIMFTAMIAAPLVIGQLLNLSPVLRTTMLTGVMLGCGIGTIISALGIGWVGSRLPLLLGAYAVYIGPVVAIAKTSSSCHRHHRAAHWGGRSVHRQPAARQVAYFVSPGRRRDAAGDHRRNADPHRGEHCSRH